MIDLLSLCLNVAYALDDVKRYVVQSSTSTTVTAVGLGNLTTSASENTYDDAWAYANDQQTRVRIGGYAPSTSILTLTTPWTVNPSALDALYITRLFPIGPGQTPGEDTPYKRFVLEALKCLIYPDILTLPMTSVDTYDLSTYSFWLDRQERLLGIREPAPVSGRRPVPASWRGPIVEQEGTTTYLRLGAPFGAGAAGNLTLDVLRPPYTLVDGVESTEGPTADAHTVEANPEDVQTGALAHAYLALATRQQTSPDGANWAAMYVDQRTRFESLEAYDKTRLMPRLPTEQGAA